MCCSRLADSLGDVAAGLPAQQALRAAGRPRGEYPTRVVFDAPQAEVGAVDPLTKVSPGQHIVEPVSSFWGGGFPGLRGAALFVLTWAYSTLLQGL
jgi:hypothetical protein